jgi:hypothetical protein
MKSRRAPAAFLLSRQLFVALLLHAHLAQPLLLRLCAVLSVACYATATAAHCAAGVICRSLVLLCQVVASAAAACCAASLLDAAGCACVLSVAAQLPPPTVVLLLYLLPPPPPTLVLMLVLVLLR